MASSSNGRRPDSHSGNAGSIPVEVTAKMLGCHGHAGEAPAAERLPCKQERAGSTPATGSQAPEAQMAARGFRTPEDSVRFRAGALSFPGPFVYRQDTGLSRRQGGFDSRTGHYLRRLRRLRLRRPGMAFFALGQAGRAANRTMASVGSMPCLRQDLCIVRSSCRMAGRPAKRMA